MIFLEIFFIRSTRGKWTPSNKHHQDKLTLTKTTEFGNKWHLCIFKVLIPKKFYDTIFKFILTSCTFS